jgi:hypothetical protein
VQVSHVLVDGDEIADVVASKPAGSPLADRTRLRPVIAGLRVRRVEIPVMLTYTPGGADPCAVVGSRTTIAVSCERRAA